VTAQESYGFGQCQAATGSERLGTCNQAAIDASGLCRYHAKCQAGVTASWLRPAESGRKTAGVFSYWSIV